MADSSCSQEYTVDLASTGRSDYMAFGSIEVPGVGIPLDIWKAIGPRVFEHLNRELPKFGIFPRPKRHPAANTTVGLLTLLEQKLNLYFREGLITDLIPKEF